MFCSRKALKNVLKTAFLCFSLYIRTIPICSLHEKKNQQKKKKKIWNQTVLDYVKQGSKFKQSITPHHSPCTGHTGDRSRWLYTRTGLSWSHRSPIWIHWCGIGMLQTDKVKLLMYFQNMYATEASFNSQMSTVKLLLSWGTQESRPEESRWQ